MDGPIPADHAAPGGPPSPADGPRVCFFVRNDYRYDGRAERAAQALRGAGYQTTVFAISNTEVGAGWAENAGSSVYRVPRTKLAPIIERLYRFFHPEYRRALAEWKAAYHERRKKKAVDPREGLGPVPRIDVRGVWQTLHRLHQTLHFARVAGPMAASLKPVVYHCHDLNTFLAGFVARLRHSAPVLYDSHEIWPHRNRSDGSRFKTWGLTQLDRLAAHLASAVVVVSEPYASYFRRRYGRRATVVRNIPSAATWGPVPAFARMDVVPSPRLVYVGIVAPNRGIEQTIDALPRLKGAQFVMVGPGGHEYKEVVRARAHRLGVADRVHSFDLVPLDAVVPTIAQGDIGLSIVQPVGLSHVSTLPNKIYEYMQAGLALVVSDFPAVRRVIEEHDVGITVDPVKPESIADGIRNLLADPEALAKKRANARKAGATLTWENEGTKLIEVYQKLGVPAQLGRRQALGQPTSRTSRR